MSGSRPVRRSSVVSGQWSDQVHSWRSSDRNWIASPMWSAVIRSVPARSAIVRATFKIRSIPNCLSAATPHGSLTAECGARESGDEHLELASDRFLAISSTLARRSDL
jgi:hypothetical protein